MAQDTFLEVRKDQFGSLFVEGRIVDGPETEDEVIVQVFLPDRLSTDREVENGNAMPSYGAQHFIFDDATPGIETEGLYAVIWGVVAWNQEGEEIWGEPGIGDLEIELGREDVKVVLYCAKL